LALESPAGHSHPQWVYPGRSQAVGQTFHDTSGLLVPLSFRTADLKRSDFARPRSGKSWNCWSHVMAGRSGCLRWHCNCANIVRENAKICEMPQKCPEIRAKPSPLSRGHQSPCNYSEGDHTCPFGSRSKKAPPGHRHYFDGVARIV
jgi:hypothetical protein